jgi:transcriptional regulator with XRE-family HTH domain
MVAVDTESRLTELAAFLRSRRERLRPELVGLPAGGRRRTPGLRREEVAQLAGVGVTWYTWLEQGRPIRPSESVLGAIASALRLDPSERAHLLTLAGIAVPDRSVVRRPPPIDHLTQRVLDALEPSPAVVVASCHTYVAWNAPALRLIGDLSVLPPERRNSMWLMFVEPAWRKLVLDWEQEAPLLVATFRGGMAEHLGEPLWQDLVDELSAVSEEFRRIWQHHAVAQPAPRIKTLLHQQLGVIRTETRNFWLTPGTGPRMIVYNPADDDAAEAMRRLADSDIEPFADWSDAARHPSPR